MRFANVEVNLKAFYDAMKRDKRSELVVDQTILDDCFDEEQQKKLLIEGRLVKREEYVYVLRRI